MKKGVFRRRSGNFHFISANYHFINYFLHSSFKKSYSQDAKDSIPDGTEGEMFATPTKDSAKLTWNEKRWRLFKGRSLHLKWVLVFFMNTQRFSRTRTVKHKWIPWVLR